jgi:CPA2 family monovalent cation:H+ antiporter-2
MVVGQSDFSARAAAEALPLRDAFAVLFFVSVGMLFDPASLAESWPLMLATLAVVLVGKSVVAVAVVLLLKRPLHAALSVAVALAQIGEFSFILAAVATNLKLLPPEATGALVVASLVSITLNPMLFKTVGPATRWLESKGLAPARSEDEEDVHPTAQDQHRVVVVGYGPVGRTLSRILRDNSIEVVVIDMNLDTVQQLRAQGESAVFGDATQHEILRHAGVENAQGLIVSSFTVAAREVVDAAKELNPTLRVFTHTTYLREAEALRASGAMAVFSGEGEVAMAMAVYLLKELGATPEQVDNERQRIRQELSGAKAS